jgi:2-polyprenyl-3-methyl-5-hydroxy-6-metoxy-1,4-benzoquinol methylase
LQTIPIWADLWKELVGLHDHNYGDGTTPEDHWNNRARTFSNEIEKRWSHPDSSRDFLVSRLCSQPRSTLVDIGAGTGAWATLAARYVASVTAIDCSPGMIAVMRENLDKAGILNVRIIQGSWPDVEVEPHDFSLCAHAMYGQPDLPGFVRKMIEATRQTCFMLIRAPKPNGLMAEFARMVLGHSHDSPNFVIAYNTLFEMGIYANVLFEDSGLWRAWANDSLEEALSEVKRRLGLVNNPAYDEFIYRRLSQELTFSDGKYFWPQGIRSALIYWDVA